MAPTLDSIVTIFVQLASCLTIVVYLLLYLRARPYLKCSHNPMFGCLPETETLVVGRSVGPGLSSRLAAQLKATCES